MGFLGGFDEGAALEQRLFETVDPGARVRVTLNTGVAFEGEYALRGGMHFVIRTGKGAPLFGAAEGPFAPADVMSVTTIVSKQALDGRRSEKLFGEPYPGRAPATREDYQYRLERLAVAIAREHDTERGGQLRRQFDGLADAISLAKPKRAWMLAAGRWARQSNTPPRLENLWFADVASPSLLARPRAQDFDPDPRERRKRPSLPAYAEKDPLSPQNVIKRLGAVGLRARIALAGDPVWDRATLVIDLTEGRLHRFMANGTRRRGGVMMWRVDWGGNDNPTAWRRHRALLRTEEYARMMGVFFGEDRSASRCTGSGQRG